MFFVSHALWSGANAPKMQGAICRDTKEWAVPDMDGTETDGNTSEVCCLDFIGGPLLASSLSINARARHLLGSENTHKEKHINKMFTGLSRDFGGILWGFVFLPTRDDPKKTHKQLFGTHPVPGQSRKFVYVYVFFPWIYRILRGLLARNPKRVCKGFWGSAENWRKLPLRSNQRTFSTDERAITKAGHLLTCTCDMYGGLPDEFDYWI